MRKLVLSCFVVLCMAIPVSAQITVNGEGKVSAVPDMATVVMSVVTDDAQAITALENNNASMSKLIKSLEALGVSKKELHTDTFHVSPKYLHMKDQEPRQVGYVVSNQLTVMVCKTDILGQVLDSSVKSGATRIDNVSWGFQDPQKLLNVARVNAVIDARRKATTMATTAGANLGTLVSINESSYQPRSPFVNYASATRADSAPSVPVEPGTQSLRVTVTVVWNVGAPRDPGLTPDLPSTGAKPKR